MEMRFLRLGQRLFYLVAMLVVFFWISPVLSASAATSVPNDREQGVPADQKITVTFGNDITNYNIVPSQIFLTDTKYPKKFLNFDCKKDPTDPKHKIIIIPKLVKSSDPDFFLLDYQKEYEVSVTANALMNGDTPLGESIDFTFKTVKQFSVMTKNDLNLLINEHSPSGINLLIPKKPITYINTSYASVDANNKPLAKPLTNIDMTVDSTNPSVAEIRTCFVNKTWVAAKRKTGDIWNAGYSGDMTTLSTDGKTTVGKDIKIRVYDDYDRVIWSYTVKLDPKGKKTEDFKSDNGHAGTITLDQLIMDGGKKLIELLKVFPIDEFQVLTYLRDYD